MTDIWLMPLAGGVLIGLAAAMLMFFHGRIAGISGIVGGMLTGDRRPWRWLFVAGLLAGGLGCVLLMPGQFTFEIDRSYGALIGAGLLVGVGTRMGSGCTSGHGVCGMARLSQRSIVATLTFMATGVGTVLLVNLAFGGSI